MHLYFRQNAWLIVILTAAVLSLPPGLMAAEPGRNGSQADLDAPTIRQMAAQSGSFTSTPDDSSDDKLMKEEVENNSESDSTDPVLEKSKKRLKKKADTVVEDVFTGGDGKSQ